MSDLSERDRFVAELAVLGLSEETLALTAPWRTVLPAIVRGGDDLPPASVFVAIVQVLAGCDTEAASGARPQAIPAGLVRQFEDHVTGRLLTDPIVRLASDAVATWTGDDAVQAIAYTVVQLIAQIGGPTRPMSRDTAQSLARTGASEMTARAWAIWSEPDFAREILHETTESLVAWTEATGLLTAADLAELETGLAVHPAGGRVALRRIVSLRTAWLAACSDNASTGKVRRQASIATRLITEAEYPVGGYSSLATRGTIESLVTSELALMDVPVFAEATRPVNVSPEETPSANASSEIFPADRPPRGDSPASPSRKPSSPKPLSAKPPSGGRTLDLFDLRWARDELLYYGRDENVFFRPETTLAVWFDPTLASRQQRHPVLDASPLIAALAWLSSLREAVERRLQGEGLTVTITTTPEAAAAELAEPWALLERIEAPALARQSVVLGTRSASDWVAETDLARRNPIVVALRMLAAPSERSAPPRRATDSEQSHSAEQHDADEKASGPLGWTLLVGGDAAVALIGPGERSLTHVTPEVAPTSAWAVALQTFLEQAF